MAYIGFFNGPNSVLSNVDQIGFRSINFKQRTQTVVTKTISGRTIRTQQATTLWEGTLEFPSLTHQEFRQVQGFVALAQGALNEFDIILPNISSRTAGGRLYNLAVKDDHTAGTTAITAYQTVDSAGSPIGADDSAGYTPADGFTILNMGDIIRFDNHSKVYMCTTDVTPDTSGDFVINIQPALTTTVKGETGAGLTDSAGAITEITYDNVPFRMVFKGDTADYRYNVDGTVNFRIDVEEVL